VLTPGEDELSRAREIVRAFEAARERGGGRVELDGALVEMPAYSNAKRLIARAEALGDCGRSVG
jgi:citrate lyase subunit beta/citryl-CoA lyase